MNKCEDLGGQDLVYGMTLLAAREDELSLHLHPCILGVEAFVPTFTFGHVRHLDAIAPRFLTAVAQAHLIAGCGRHPRRQQGGYALADDDDTIIDVRGHARPRNR